MADSIELPHLDEVEEEDPHQQQQQQMEITNNQPPTEPYDDEDYVDDDDDDDDSDEEDDQQQQQKQDEEDDSYSESEEDEEEEEYMDSAPAVMSTRVSVNSVEVDGEGGKVAAPAPAAAGEGSEVDGLVCSICMGPWTNGGDHQLCCLSCGHLYGLSCIRRWLERCKGSAKCPQCNQKCKQKDVRVIYASRVVVADEESKEKIQRLEAKMSLLEKMIERLGPRQEAIHQKLTVIEQFHQEQRTHWRERAQVEDRRYEEQCTFQQKLLTFLQVQRTFQLEQQQKFSQFSRFMEQQTSNSSQPSTPLPPGPGQ